ncbi:hypothetical protein NLM27_25435 [Bradyrhizobium sp. CCGB12]|uniref:hypothetical protein n=1 Tax=Bradyrhizobium sp. CCGB12 TaxID=2949632 RepID=UPI0020B1E7A7|nr:hypothetical protein [Bradyrhizobium sp. CCGB12]MCP3392131.1 hypothetical protein [Bradyrhizobium sp. CCGB12]
MTTSRMEEALASVAKIENIIRKFRVVIDTDSSIPPDLRDTLHATLDKHLLAAKRRALNHL